MSGMMLAFAGGSYSAAPVNTVAPVVSGTATFGQTLTTTNGTWTGAPAPSFTYQWQRATTNIGGATSSTYVLVAADVGNTIRCVVTATNIIAAVSANSNSTASVAASVPGAPTIGTATSTGSTTATVAYTAPASNGGATITQYDAVSSPAGGTGTLVQAGSGTISVTGLTQNTSYTFTVKATNSVGQSAASAASNSITTDAVNNFIATVYDTSDPFSTDSATYGVAYSGSTMFTVGVQKLLTAGTTTLLICSYTSTGTLNWKKYISSTNIDSSVARLGPSCVCDSAGNLYVVYVTAGGQNRTMKLNSSGVIQWQKRISGLVGSFNTPFILAVDSSDGLYIAGQYNTSKRGLIKFDTSGSSVWAYELSASGQGTIDNDTKMALTTGGGYVYVFSNGIVPGGGAGHVLFKISTSGSLTETVSMSGAYAYGSAVNSSSQLVIGARTSGSFNVGLVAQFDPTALTSGPTWQGGLASTTFVSAVATDSSNNVYVSCSHTVTTRRFTFAKYNSSGTIQFQRRWTESTGARNSDAYSIAMASSGKVAVLGKNSNDVLHGGITVIFNTIVPTDGTSTGTYTNNGVSYVYDASTMTTTSPSFSYTTRTGTATSFLTDFIAASETIADATNLSSSVTTL